MTDWDLLEKLWMEVAQSTNTGSRAPSVHRSPLPHTWCCRATTEQELWWGLATVFRKVLGLMGLAVGAMWTFR